MQGGLHLHNILPDHNLPEDKVVEQYSYYKVDRLQLSDHYVEDEKDEKDLSQLLFLQYQDQRRLLLLEEQINKVP